VCSADFYEFFFSLSFHGSYKWYKRPKIVRRLFSMHSPTFKKYLFLSCSVTLSTAHYNCIYIIYILYKKKRTELWPLFISSIRVTYDIERNRPL
jgi:hypothetical protein